MFIQYTYISCAGCIGPRAVYTSVDIIIRGRTAVDKRPGVGARRVIRLGHVIYTRMRTSAKARNLNERQKDGSRLWILSLVPRCFRRGNTMPPLPRRRAFSSVSLSLYCFFPRTVSENVYVRGVRDGGGSCRAGGDGGRRVASTTPKAAPRDLMVRKIK